MTTQYSEKTFAPRIAVVAHHEVTYKSGRTWPLAVGSGSMGRDRTFCGKLTQPFCQQTEFSKYISYNAQRTKFNPQVSLPPIFLSETAKAQ